MRWTIAVAATIVACSSHPPPTSPPVETKSCDYMKVPDSCAGQNKTLCEEPNLKKGNSCDPDKPRATRCEKDLYRICMADQGELYNYHRHMDHCDPDEPKLPKAYPRHVSNRIVNVQALAQADCLQKPEDFAAAALIFLHSETTKYNTPETYLQAYQWARRAAELGDVCHRRYMAHALVKYQAALKNPAKYSIAFSKLPDGCTCYSVRPYQSGVAMERQIACATVEKDRDGKNCSLRSCPDDKLAVAKGTLPGFW